MPRSNTSPISAEARSGRDETKALTRRLWKGKRAPLCGCAVRDEGGLDGCAGRAATGGMGVALANDGVGWVGVLPRLATGVLCLANCEFAELGGVDGRPERSKIGNRGGSSLSAGSD